MCRGQWGQWGGPWGPPPAEEGHGPEEGPGWMHHEHHRRHHRHGNERFGPPWMWGRRPFGPPWMWGGQPFGPPWARGWGRGGPEQGQEREAFRNLRPVIGQIMALLRAADARNVPAIQAALEDTRRRIAAILAEETPPAPPAPPTPTAQV